MVQTWQLTVVDPESICQGNKVITSTQFIGKDKNVKLEHITCDALNSSQVIDDGALLQARQASVCGANCMFNACMFHRNCGILIIESG
jgi:hypothetical protein